MGEHSPKPIDRMALGDMNCSGGAPDDANSAISGDGTPSFGRPRYNRSSSGGAKLPVRDETNPIMAGVSDPSTGKALIRFNIFALYRVQRRSWAASVYIRVTSDGAVSVRPRALASLEKTPLAQA